MIFIITSIVSAFLVFVSTLVGLLPSFSMTMENDYMRRVHSYATEYGLDLSQVMYRADTSPLYDPGNPAATTNNFDFAIFSKSGVPCEWAKGYIRKSYDDTTKMFTFNVHVERTKVAP